MIRHAKNAQTPNIDEGDLIRLRSEHSDEQPDQTADPRTAASCEKSPLSVGSFVPPARGVFASLPKSRPVLTKNNAVSARLSLVFFAILLAAAILLPLTASLKSSETQDSGEWPALTFDDYFSGRYTKGITERYNTLASDHVLLRSAGKTIRSFFGPGDPEPAVPDNSTADAASSLQGSPDLSSDDTYYDVVQNRNYHITNTDVLEAQGHLIVKQDGHWRALSLYEGGDVSVYAGTINYIRQMLDDSVNIYVMPIPKAVQFYIPANYADRNVDMNGTYRSLTIKLISKITPIDIIEVLNNHNLEPVFLRTDIHWAPLAAYYAAREFTRAASVPFDGLDTYSSREHENYLGSLYAVTGSAEILNDPETFVYYIPTGSYTADYYAPDLRHLFSGGLFFDVPDTDLFHVLLGRDDYIVRITTDTSNARKLLLVKDSSANALVPFLTGSFEEIYVIDQRHFNLNLIRFVNTVGITDLLLAQDYDYLSDEQAELLEYITYSNLEAPITDLAPQTLPPDGSNPDLTSETYPVPLAPEEISSEPETTALSEELSADPPAEEDVYWEADWYAEEEWADTAYEDTYWEEDYGQEEYVYQEDAYEESYWDDEY